MPTTLRALMLVFVSAALRLLNSNDFQVANNSAIRRAGNLLRPLFGLTLVAVSAGVFFPLCMD